MNTAANLAEYKFSAIVMNAPVGIFEMDDQGSIVFLNTKAQALLAPLFPSFSDKTNVHHLLASLAPGILDEIRSSTDDNGLIINDVYKLSVIREGQPVVRYFKIMVNRLQTDSLILALEDVTLGQEKELAFKEAMVDKTVAQGKFEIAADVLHDIGNAIVGLGSYLTRIRRTMENNNTDNLQQLSTFFAARQAEMGSVLGEAKAAAVVTMLQNLVRALQANQEEIQKSVNQQLSIITHIQELLNIQRQYVVGGDSVEKSPANLRSIINDSLSMLYASMEKRGIQVSAGINVETPVIQGHRTKLMQVIMNILKNSIEAIAPDAADKRIELGLCQQGQSLIFTVSDTGHGFDQDTGSRLFQRGFTTKSSGTGLGLHNCLTILESHDASISLTSEGKGKGSLTTIKFKI